MKEIYNFCVIIIYKPTYFKVKLLLITSVTFFCNSYGMDKFFVMPDHTN